MLHILYEARAVMYIQKLTILFILAITFALSACGTIPVKEYSYSSRSGSESRTVQYHGIDQHCATKRPNIRIKQKPANGTISIRDEKMKIPGGPADIGSKGPCIGRTVIGRVVYYTPNDGFTGKDEILIDVSKRSLSAAIAESGAARK